MRVAGVRYSVYLVLNTKSLLEISVCLASARMAVDRDSGGFEAEFVQPLPLEYECPICQLAFRDPVQIEECGHRFCSSCLNELIKRRYTASDGNLG